MPHVPPSGGGAPTSLDASHGPVQPFKKVWRDTLKLSPWHLKALEVMPIDWISPLETNLPFDSATRYPVGSEERLACSATLEHYLKIGSVQELPLETSGSLWSTFFPVPKKGTDKMRGCVDLCKPNRTGRMEHAGMVARAHEHNHTGTSKHASTST